MVPQYYANSLAVFWKQGKLENGKFLVLKYVWLFKWKLPSSTFFATACYTLQDSSNFWV